MSCAARYQETTSLEFILNPFKFFFTDYVKKSRHSEQRQASLVNAVSSTYNLGPLATIEARIKSGLPAWIAVLHFTYLIDNSATTAQLLSYHCANTAQKPRTRFRTFAET